MKNFPQSFEPVNSDSILEQFLQLKGNVNLVNTGMEAVEQKADSALEQVATKQEKLTAGTNINIENNVISATGDLSSEWGKIDGNIENQTDLINKFNSVNQSIATTNTKIDSDIQAVNQSITTTNTKIDSDIQAVNQSIATTNTKIDSDIQAVNQSIALKQDKLTAGNNIKIENNVISVDSTELIYDMASTNSAINLGYTNGIIGGTIINIPAGMKYLKISFQCYYFSSGNHGVTNTTLTMNITNNAKSNIIYGGMVTPYYPDTLYTYNMSIMVEYNISNRTLIPRFSSAGSNVADNAYIVTKIEGVK